MTESQADPMFAAGIFMVGGVGKLIHVVNRAGIFLAHKVRRGEDGFLPLAGIYCPDCLELAKKLKGGVFEDQGGEHEQYD